MAPRIPIPLLRQGIGMHGQACPRPVSTGDAALLMLYRVCCTRRGSYRRSWYGDVNMQGARKLGW
jgi:hypothetical protein